jgi:UDP-2-acetamido-3-amino-2,3-dideoxy-glucuronate N-acetyltransferase
VSDSVEHPTHNVRPNWLTETSLAFVDPTSRVGRDSRVWHFAIVLQHAIIGERCSIGSRAEIGRGTRVGNDSRIGSGVFLPPNTTVGERVFIGPNVVCCDDKLPRVAKPGDSPYKAEPPIIEDDAVIGAGAVILPGIRIGKGARVAAGAIVTKSVPDFAMVRNPHPARFRTMPEAWEHARAIPA